MQSFSIHLVYISLQIWHWKHFKCNYISVTVCNATYPWYVCIFCYEITPNAFWLHFIWLSCTGTIFPMFHVLSFWNWSYGVCLLLCLSEENICTWIRILAWLLWIAVFNLLIMVSVANYHKPWLFCPVMFIGQDDKWTIWTR